MLRLTRPVYIGAVIVSVFLLHFFFFSATSPHSQPLSDPSFESSNPRYVPTTPRKGNSGASGSNGSKAHAGGKGSGRKSSALANEIYVDERGLATYVPGLHEKHPIEMLIERAKKQAQVVESQINEVQTLEDAVEEYERAFKIRPPAGFDKWWKFTRKFNPPTVGAPNLLSAAHNMMLPFLSHPASLLRDRVQKAIDDKSPGKFYFTLVPNGEGDEGTACSADQTWLPADGKTRGRGRVRVSGTQAWQWRANNTLQLLLPVMNYFPEEMFHQDPPFIIAFSTDDGPHGMVHYNFRERSNNLARAGRVWPESQLKAAEQSMRWTYGWQWACPDGAPLKSDATDLVLNDLHNKMAIDEESGSSSSRKTFIGDFGKAMDYCYNPNLMELHANTIMDQTVAAGELEPFIGNCRTTWNTDISGVPLDGAWEVSKYIPWEEKHDKKLFWRGTATGAFHAKDIPWRKSQRERLHFWSHNESTSKIDIIVDRRGEGGNMEVEKWPVKSLNHKFIDVGISGKVAQCNVDDGSCDDLAREVKFMDIVSKEKALDHKYVLDVDGNGWSSRFRRLLGGNNVVLKSTLFPEWFSDLMIPWYHFIPVKLDYSDIYDIMTFFVGAPDGWISVGHDEMAKEIAQNALNFIENRYREADMQAFEFLLILEWWRVMSDDREKATYQT